MRKGRPRRNGYVLVLVAMLLFGLFAMAALVIDLGFARLAQRQMQSAADSAALEGLRGEGVTEYAERQEAAERMIAWTLNDEFDVTTSNAGTVDFGAVASFSGGAGESGLNGSQLMTIDASSSNVVQRSPSLLATSRFSVAVQRGGVVDREFDLFAHGPSVAYLFARGSLLDRGRVGDGIAVGGVATAESRPVVRAGPPVVRAGPPVLNLPGVVPVAFALLDWGASPTNPVTITSDISQGLSIGQSISVGGTATPPADGYCVVYDPEISRVIGFGLLGQRVTNDGVVASWNATASLSAVSDTWNMLNSAQRSEVRSANLSLTHALKAPVLVRN